MGSAVGGRLVAAGAEVLSAMDGRSPASLARIRDVGMRPVALAELVAADLILSIVPPAEAVSVARNVASAARAAGAAPAVVDFNAVNPVTMAEASAILEDAGCRVIDGAIIGLPPRPGQPGPTFYVAGDTDHRTDVLAGLGLVMRRIDGPIGAASALKMSYAALNKGLVALGTAVFLAAERAGAIEGLRAEMAQSLPDILGRLSRSIPDMYPKAYRWVAEMHEIAEFLGEDDPAAPFFRAAADVFATIADDRASGGDLVARLDRALAPPASN